MALQSKDIEQMIIGIQKALRPVEMPLKIKHVRSTIIGTFKDQGADIFWMAVKSQKILENRFTAWHFCHLLHRVLREGHPLCVQHSIKYKETLVELGKLWSHLKDAYGEPIKNYTELLIKKIDFHELNPQMPENLNFSEIEYDVVGCDTNKHFELAVEIFDYLEALIALEVSIFKSLDSTRTSTALSAGQCLIAPLVPVFQEAKQLYQILVELMFNLHCFLTNDVLAGHKQRFQIVFFALSRFYNRARTFESNYGFEDIPVLPTTAPRFHSTIVSDHNNYQTPQNHIHEQNVPSPSTMPTTTTFVNDLIDLDIPIRSPLSPSAPSFDFFNNK